MYITLQQIAMCLGEPGRPDLAGMIRSKVWQILCTRPEFTQPVFSNSLVQKSGILKTLNFNNFNIYIYR